MSKENRGIELGLKLQRFTRHEVLIINHSLTKISEFKGNNSNSTIIFIIRVWRTYSYVFNNMILGIGLISILSALFGIVSCYVGGPINMSCENGVCSRKDDQGPCVVTDDEQRLFRWDPVKVISVKSVTQVEDSAKRVR